MDFADSFVGQNPPAPPPEIEPAEVPASPPEQASEPDQEPAPEAPSPVTPPAAPETERNVPLASMLDERDKRKALERELAELKAAQQRQPADIPDPYDDPDGFRAYEATQRENVALNLRFEFSETMARDKHGDDAVSAAMEWGATRAQTDEAFRIDFLKQKNPIDWVVRQQKRDGLLSEVGDDPDAYVLRRAAAMGWSAPDAGAGTTPVPGQQQAPKSAPPPRSLTSMPGAGGNVRDVAIGPTAGLDAIFKR